MLQFQGVTKKWAATEQLYWNRYVDNKIKTKIFTTEFKLFLYGKLLNNRLKYITYKIKEYTISWKIVGSF